MAAGLVRSAHDCAEGGLAVALAEAALGTGTGRPGESIRGALGAVITLEPPPSSRLDGVLFGESQSRIIITIQEDIIDKAKVILKSFPAPWSVIGRVGGDRLTIMAGPAGSHSHGAAPARPVVDIDLASLHNSWSQGLSRHMGEFTCR
jgi:phosphoribosylformylglycinamidine synthase